MTIIFDFNRTVFDPETDTLVPGVLDALNLFKERGIPMHLVSKLEAGRENALETLHIADFFNTKHFVEQKEEAMRKIIETAEGPVYVVGDYLHNEIRIGNKLGAKTVWFKRGRFSTLLPETENDVPWKTISGMHELKELI